MIILKSIQFSVMNNELPDDDTKTVKFLLKEKFSKIQVK